MAERSGSRNNASRVLQRHTGAFQTALLLLISILLACASSEAHTAGRSSAAGRSLHQAQTPAAAPTLSPSQQNDLLAVARAPSPRSSDSGVLVGQLDSLLIQSTLTPAPSFGSAITAGTSTIRAFGPAAASSGATSGSPKLAPAISVQRLQSAPTPTVQPGNNSVIVSALTALTGNSIAASKFLAAKDNNGTLGLPTVDNLRSLLTELVTGNASSPAFEGKLNLNGSGASNFVAKQGILAASGTGSTAPLGSTTSGSYLQPSSKLVAFTGVSLPASFTTSISIGAGTASWVYDTITIPDNSRVVLDTAVKSFTLFAKNLVIGTNVQFTWQPSTDKTVPQPKITIIQTAPPGKGPLSLSDSEFPKGNNGYKGTNGSPGLPGNPGLVGDTGPTLSLIYQNLTLLGVQPTPPSFVLSGQAGQTGGQGGTGGPGGKGAQGIPAIKDTYWGVPWGCKHNNGYGSDGGDGGAGGTGGLGGQGGGNGLLNVYTVSEGLLQLGAGTFLIYSDVGPPGSGGSPGDGGAGGPGGEPGPNDVSSLVPFKCNRDNTRVGNPGTKGPQGAVGANGAAGVRTVNERIFPLGSQQLQDCFTSPQIKSYSPTTPLTPNTNLYIAGSNFAANVNVTVQGTVLDPSNVQVSNSTSMRILLPANLPGPTAVLTVGNQSNICPASTTTILVGLNLGYLEQTDVGRVGQGAVGNYSTLFRPGYKARLYGTGFGPKMRILINDSVIPASDTNSYPDEQYVEFVLRRPGSFDKYDASAKWGEPVAISVVHEDSSISAPPPVIVKLDTYHIVVLGDSVHWGSGNSEATKHYSLLAAWLTKQFKDQLGVYVTVMARSGAALIRTDPPTNGVLSWPPEAAEIPANAPSISEQSGNMLNLAARYGTPSSIKLVLLNGCANDIDIMSFVCPRRYLIQDTLNYCGDVLGELLKDLQVQLPEALFVLSDYYNGINLSNLDVFQKAAVFIKTVKDVFDNGLKDCGPSTAQFNNILFKNFARTAIQQQVDKYAMGSRNKTQAVFAKNTFQTFENAAFGSNPFVYGLEDSAPTQDYLKQNCPVYSPGNEICAQSYVLHPNAAGMYNYFQAFQSALLASNNAHCGRYCSLVADAK